MKKGKSAKSQLQHPNGHVLPFKFGKLLDPEASWDKDQLGDVLHWIRQLLGVVCGLLCGAVPLIGAIWIALFLAVSSGIIYGYYAYILKIDEEEFGGHGALLQEGLFASFTLFLVGLSNFYWDIFLYATACVDTGIQLGTFLVGVGKIFLLGLLLFTSTY